MGTKMPFLNINDTVYVMVPSSFKHHIMFLMGATIVDIKYDKDDPQYKIKIHAFYDSFQLLKRYFFRSNFVYNFDKRARPNRLNQSFKNIDEMYEEMNNNPDRYKIIVSSLYCFRKKYKMIEAFSKYQDFQIKRFMSECRRMSVRGLYDGKYRFNTLEEWDRTAVDILKGDIINDIIHK